MVDTVVDGVVDGVVEGVVEGVVDSVVDGVVEGVVEIVVEAVVVAVVVVSGSRNIHARTQCVKHFSTGLSYFFLFSYTRVTFMFSIVLSI